MDIMLLVLFLGAFFLLSIARPLHGVLAVIVLLPSYLWRFSFLGLPTTFLEWCILLLFAAWLIRARWPRQAVGSGIGVRFRGVFESLHRAHLLGPIVLFFVASIVAVVVAPDQVAALGIWRAFVFEPLLFVVVLLDSARGSSGIRSVFWALAISGLVVSIGSLIQSVTGWALPVSYTGVDGPLRITSFFEYPASVGLFLTPIILLILGALIVKSDLIERKFWPAAWLISGLGIIAVALSQTEGAYVGILLGVFFVSVFRWRWKPVAVAAICAVLFFAISPIRERFLPVMMFQDGSGQVRLAIWEGAFSLLSDHPVRGAGLAGFTRVYDDYRLAQHTEFDISYPHSLFLNFWIELTVFGAIAVLWSLVSFSGLAEDAARRAPPEARTWMLVLAGSVLGVVVYGFVDAPFFKNDLAILWWIPFALAVLISRDFKYKTASKLSDAVEKT